jgi:hypothetical protein
MWAAWAILCNLLTAAGVAAAEPTILNLRSLPLIGNETQARVDTRPAVFGDRFVYDGDDEIGQFWAFVQPRKDADLTGATMHLALLSGKDAAVLEEASVPAATTKVLFQLRVARLPTGAYSVKVTLRDAAGAGLAEPVSFAFTRTDQRRESLPWPKAGLPLQLREQQTMPNATWPTHAPVALPVGLVRDVSELSLHEDGKPVAAQIMPVARWGPGEGAWLKWVHVHFQARYREGKPAAYTLQLKSAAPAPTSGLQVTQDDKLITVDTGVLKFTVSKAAFAGLSQAWVDASGKRQYDDAALVIDGKDGGPYIVDSRLIRFDAARGQDVKVEVEEAGPVRVVIRATGWLGSEEKRVPPICLFNTRLFAYAGQAAVRVQQHTILGYDSRMYRLADVGFTLASPRGAKVSMGVDGQAVGGDLPATGTAFLHQDRHDRLRVVGLSKEPLAGGRADGWFQLQPAQPGAAGLTVALRDVWQKFPKEVEFSRQGLTLHFWPAHGHRAYSPEEEMQLGEIHKFWCFHQHRLMDLTLPNDYFERLGTYPGTMENVPQHALNGNGQGLAIGNDFLVQLGDPSSAEPAALAKLHDDNPVALPPPSWNAATGAMGDIAAADDPKYQEIENAIEQSLLSYTRSVERGQAYGMWNYADTHTYFEVPRERPNLHRVWLNSHYHNVGKTWLLYFRSGSRDLLRWARVSTDHYINVDTVNWADYDDTEDRLKSHLPGAMYHCKGQTHWGGEAYGMQRRDTHAGLWGHWVDPDASLWCWYLDANPRARDLYQLWHDSVRKYGMIYRGTRREINTSLAITCSLYEATWDPEVLLNIHGMGESLRTAEPLTKQFPGPMWHPLWINRYFELTRDPAYVPFILEHGSAQGIGDTWIVALSGLAYRLSNDPRYLTVHFDRLLEMPRNFYHHEGDAYDWYGWGPGPLGSRWFWMGWPTYLKQLQRSKLTVQSQAIPAGGYPYTPARFNTYEVPSSLTVYLLEPKDQAITLDFRAGSLGGDLHATSLRVLSPSGKVVLQDDRIAQGGSSVHYSKPLPADGETGVYQVEFRGHEAHIGGPISDVKIEGAQARMQTTYRGSRVYSHVQPIGPAVPVTLTIQSESDGTPCNAIVRDARGTVVATASLFRPRPQKQLVVSLDPAVHPLPWLIDVVGLSSLRFEGEAKGMLIAPRAESIAALAKAVQAK